MNELLKGHSAIITGGTIGIGLAIARIFAKHGAHVVLFGTNQERGEEAAAKLNAELAGQDASFFAVDVSQTAAVEEAVKQVIARHGKVDILVNNAGITRDQLLMKMSEAEWDAVINTNLKSCYNTCRALIRSMMKAKKGKIINISSVVGLTGNAGQINYAASKGGMIALTKALALEVASRQIQVNCIAPGFIETRMTEVLTEAQKESILSKIPLGRMGSPEDIANAALYLASDLSNYITGQVLTVDGGMVM